MIVSSIPMYEEVDISGKLDKTSVSAGTIGTSSATSGATIAVPYANITAGGAISSHGTHTHTISGLSTSAITSGTFDASIIGSGTINSARIGSVAATSITGTLATSQIPNLDASKITSGTIDGARISGASIKPGTNVATITTSGTWTVPTGIYQLEIWACGGGGGSGTQGAGAGSGGVVYGFYSVTPGQVLTILVGSGGGTYNSGGRTQIRPLAVCGGGQGSYYTKDGEGTPTYYGGKGTAGGGAGGAGGAGDICGDGTGNGTDRHWVAGAGVASLNYNVSGSGYCPIDGNVYCNGGSYGSSSGGTVYGDGAGTKTSSPWVYAGYQGVVMIRY